MLATANKGESLGPGISDVHGNVPAVLTQPPQGNRGTVPVSTPQRKGERRWNGELKECSAEDVQGLAAKGEHQMAGFVNRQVETIQPAIAFG